MRHRAWRTTALRRALARQAPVVEHLLLALAALLPQVTTQPGVIDADTKTYLFLEPGRYLRQSLSMWDPTVGLGTVTHQQIGYLFPMGPFFWATHAVTVPTWVAERLWVALILFAAGTGVWWLARTIGLGRPGRMVAALAYMLSPYTLQYVGHISVILLAFAALPWLTVLVERSTTGSWRPVAVTGLVVAAMGSVNASSAIYVSVGPLLWLAYAGFTRLHPWRAVWRGLWRCGLVAAVVSAWWVVGLLVEGGYGIDVLRYTETIPAVSSSSLASEVVRGLGYWYFYGGDNFGDWVSAMPQFTQQLWLLAVGYVTPLLALASVLSTRWRHRVAFLAMTVVGMVLAVGAYRLSTPSPAALVMGDLLSSGTVGLALRSTDRATPLVLLGLAALLGAGVTALGRRSPLAGLAVAGVAVAAVVAGNPALWNGTSVPSTFTEKAITPYERQAAAALNHSAPGTAVLGLPGQNFASTDFGSTTVDPIWPALLTRPFVTREEQVMGSLPTEDLLYAMDDPIQSGVEDPAALAPLARLMGVGDLLVQDDLAFTRYDQPDPAVLWSSILTEPAGLGPVASFGPTRPALNRSSVVDEQTYTLPTTLPLMPALAVVPVNDPRPLVRAEAATAPLVVDGDGVGLDDIAGTGLLSGNPTVVYAGTLDTDRAARKVSLQPGATLVVTDSNRRQAFRWDDLTDVADATLAADQPYPSSPQDKPLDIFPGAPAGAQTTTAVTGVAAVTASDYANPFQYLPEDRPVGAVDGDPDTAWQVGPYLDPRGQWWQVHLSSPRAADAVTIVQPHTGVRNQWITAVTLRFDGRAPVRAVLGSSSRRGSGQVIHFSTRTFRTLRVTIDSTNLSPAQSLAGGVSSVGLAEVGIDGVQATEHVVMPEDLLRAAGSGSLADRLSVVMTRLRVAPATSRTDPEDALVRTVWLPTTRTFTLTGTARLDDDDSDQSIDRLVGRTGSGSTVVASSSGRLQGDVADTASAALDGDPDTVWSSPLGAGQQIGQSITVQLARAITVGQLALQVVVDGRHSVPSRLRISAASGSSVVVLPKLVRQDHPDGTDAVRVSFPPVTGSTISVTVLGIRPLRAVDYYGGGDVTLPVAIAELGVPGVQMPAPPPDIPSPCRSDLLQVDGKPVWVEVSGTSAAALTGTGLSVSLCGPDAGGVTLGPGTHQVVATPGRRSGIDLDQLILDSAPGGGPETGDGPSGVVPAPTPGAPTVHVLRRQTTTLFVRVTRPTTPAAGSPFWLVLGESLNRGWQATVVGGPSLGTPQLVDGFANGWLVVPAALGGRRSFEVSLRWAPQSTVDLALVVSLVAGVVCLAVAICPRRRRRRSPPQDAHGTAVAPDSLAAVPELSPPHFADAPAHTGRRPAWWRVLAAAVSAGVVAGSVTVPAAGAGVFLAVAAACLARRGRLALAAASVAALAATAVTMVVIEAVGGYPGDGQWPSHFAAAAVLTWLALVLAVGETLVRYARRLPDASDGDGVSDDARPGAPAVSPSPSPPS